MAPSIDRVARRACSVVLIGLAWFALAVTSASAQCGQTVNVSSRRPLGLGRPPLAIGDSVLYDAAETLAEYGFETNAMVCRTMGQGIAWLYDHADRLPVLVVVALGTNGSVTTRQIDELLTIVGARRSLAMVTPRRGNYAYVPGLIRTAAQQHRGRIVVLDWDRLSADHPDWFAPDGIHLGGAAGIRAYARLVASSLLLAPAPMPAPTVKHPAPAPTVSHPAPTPTVKHPAPAPTVKRPAPPPEAVHRPKLAQTSPGRPAQPPEVIHADRIARLVVSAVDEVSRSLARM